MHAMLVIGVLAFMSGLPAAGIGLATGNRMVAGLIPLSIFSVAFMVEFLLLGIIGLFGFFLALVPIDLLNEAPSRL
jgi:hypothetical protein